MRLYPGRRAFAIQFDDLRLDMLRNQIARCALGHNAACVENREAVAESLRFVHEMRRQQNRLAFLQQTLQALPDQVTRLRIEAGGRLVEQQQVRIVHQRACQRQAPLHAAGECREWRRLLAGESGEIE